MTIPDQFRKQFLNLMSKEDITVKDAVRRIINNNPAIFSFGLAAYVLDIEENKLRCDTKKRRSRC